jgi:hypothetical protein
LRGTLIEVGCFGVSQMWQAVNQRKTIDIELLNARVSFPAVKVA